MKFLVDAQLPRRFANWLNEAGHDALHTLELPRKNLTTDLRVEPLLLLISTGNINNAELEKLLRSNLSGIEAAFASSRFVEITRDALVVRE